MMFCSSAISDSQIQCFSKQRIFVCVYPVNTIRTNQVLQNIVGKSRYIRGTDLSIVFGK